MQQQNNNAAAAAANSNSNLSVPPVETSSSALEMKLHKLKFIGLLQNGERAGAIKYAR
jgi:hypothetical protein